MNTPMLNIRGPAVAEALTLVRAGEGLTAAFDFGGQFTLPGPARGRKASPSGEDQSSSRMPSLI